MAEQSVNVTVEQATLQQSRQLLSLSNLSSIEYEQAYSFLSESNFSGDHVQISNVCLNPPSSQYQIRFFELKNNQENKKYPQSITCETNSRLQQSERHKIMSLNIKQENKYDKVVRLPRSNKPIQLQIQSKNQGLLRGKIIEEESQIESPLYNEKGERVATLQYDIRIPNSKNNQQKYQEIEYNEENTLHSNDFQINQSQNNSRLKEFENEYRLQKIQEQLENKLDRIEQEDQQKAQKFTTTMSASSKVVRVVRRRKKYQAFDEGNQSEIQQRGSQDYELNLLQKVNSYQNPFGKKQKAISCNKKQVDFLSLRKSKQELGLTAVNLEEIIYPKYVRNRFDSHPEQLKKFSSFEKNQNPQVRIVTEPAAASNRVNYQDYGVGTYSPLSTDKSSVKQTFNSFRQNAIKANALKVNLKKLKTRKVQNQAKPTSKHRQQDSEVKQSEDEYTTKRRGKSQKKNFLNKFFMTNRQQQVKKTENDIKNQRSKQLRKNIKLENKVLQIKVQDFPKTYGNITPVVLQKIPLKEIKEQKVPIKEKKSHSCKDSPLRNESNYTSLSDSQLYPQYNLTINNISLNFRRKTFGSKYLTIKLNGAKHLTQKLNGNNLMWSSKSYKFQRVNQTDELNIQVKGQSIQEEIPYGNVRIAFNDLLINKKQSYYQTFLLSEKQVLGIMILGYQILKKKDTLRNYIYPESDKRKSHAQSQIKKFKEFDDREYKPKKHQYVSGNYLGKLKLPSPRANAIKAKKYLGGKNIKIARASRFEDESKLCKPGPGYYEIESSFSRHALKQD